MSFLSTKPTTMLRHSIEHEQRLNALETRIDKMEIALFHLGLDFCEYCTTWHKRADMLQGVTDFESCCVHCIERAYDREGPELPQLDQLHEELAWQFCKHDALRRAFPQLWSSILQPLVCNSAFKAKYPML